jgi:phasin family protein
MAEAATATTEPFTTAANVAFKDGVEKTLAAIGEVNAHSKKNLEALIASATATAKGAESLGARAAAYSKSTFDSQVSAAKALAGAKSVQEAIELQTAFAKTALETYVAEVGKMTEAFTATVKDAVSPLSARVTDVVETMQAAR